MNERANQKQKAKDGTQNLQTIFSMRIIMSKFLLLTMSSAYVSCFDIHHKKLKTFHRDRQERRHWILTMSKARSTVTVNHHNIL